MTPEVPNREELMVLMSPGRYEKRCPDHWGTEFRPIKEGLSFFHGSNVEYSNCSDPFFMRFFVSTTGWLSWFIQFQGRNFNICEYVVKSVNVVAGPHLTTLVWSSLMEACHYDFTALIISKWWCTHLNEVGPSVLTSVFHCSMITGTNPSNPHTDLFLLIALSTSDRPWFTVLEWPGVCTDGTGSLVTHHTSE